MQFLETYVAGFDNTASGCSETVHARSMSINGNSSAVMNGTLEKRRILAMNMQDARKPHIGTYPHSRCTL